MENNKIALVDSINQELSTQLTAETYNSLMSTAFKGFKSKEKIKEACLEIMLRGYKFDDIVKKKIYAITYGGEYSLVQSINDVRTIAIASKKYAGKSEPIFEEKDGKVISCTIIVKRIVEGYIAEFPAKVYFNEYNTGKNLWVSKPRTMIAKIAEMHALRMAFPDLITTYIEEEFESEHSKKDFIEVKSETQEEREYARVYNEIENINDAKKLREYFLNNKGIGAKATNLIVEKGKLLAEAEKNSKEQSKKQITDEEIPVIDIDAEIEEIDAEQI